MILTEFRPPHRHRNKRDKKLKHCEFIKLLGKIKTYKNSSKHITMIRIRIGSLNALLIAVPLLFSLLYAPAHADSVKDAQELAKQGKHAEALDQLNKFLSTHPKDPQARFQKGVILTEQNKSNEAIKVFSDLTQDYPSLPEPYNNLAVLYFSLGQYDKAKAALESAIRTHPSYATAHENLGDIYAKMASQAYDKALQLDKSNTTAQTKLALVKELFTPGTKGAHSAQVKPYTSKPAVSVVALNTPKIQAAPVPAAAPAIRPIVAAKLSPTPATPPAAGKPAAVSVPVAGTPPPVKTAAVVPPKPVEDAKQASSTKPSAKPYVEQKTEVLRTLNTWAKAWSAGNANGYLAFYGKSFKTPNGEKRADWEQTRKERISKPKSIQVAIVAPEVKFDDATHATVYFKQIYRSDSLQTSTKKTMTLVKAGEKWFILEERVGR